MKNRSFHKKIFFRLRFVTYLLIISGSLNVGLFLTFVIHASLEKQKQITTFTSPVFQEEIKKDIQDFSNKAFLMEMKKSSFRELATYLSDKEQLEQGYCKRDLALACLVAYHNFNLEKVIEKEKWQKREITYEIKGEKLETIILFSGLNDFQYEAIIYYAYTEKWPLTAKGLFSLIKKTKKKTDISLLKTFMLTKEFELICNLFEHHSKKVSKEKLLQLLLELRWEIIDNFVYEQIQLQDLTKERQRVFLLSCLEEKSSTAAQILLEIDREYITKRLNDIQILSLLELLPISGETVQNFCLELLKSSRSDEVWKASAVKLYLISGEKMPEPFDHKKVLSKFIVFDEKKSLSEDFQEKTFSSIHVVKEGETLWKIARFYKVNVKEIKKANHLRDDKIFPGLKIIIPKNR